MERRTFVKQSAMAGTLLIGNAASWAGANDRVGVAGMGMGGRGGQLMRMAAELDNVEVVAVCDPDKSRSEQRAAEVGVLSGKKVEAKTDIRDLLEHDNVDAVTVTTCNHWHALAAIWSIQAGKHVYVEKPVCHNVFEGRKTVEASRKHNKLVQGGTQRRSYGIWRKAVEMARGGAIGDIHMARCLVYNQRNAIGFEPVEEPPAGLDWNLWVGPAPMQPYHANLVHYNWHWFWDFGNGELGNNGSHFLDVARWGLNKGLPVKIESTGGRFGYNDQGQTPNTQSNTFQYEDGTILTCEVRGRFTHDECGNRFGVIFYGSEGWMAVSDGEIQWSKGNEGEMEPAPEHGPNTNHYQNFVDAIRAGKREMLNAEIEETYLSCALCCLGNIAYRLNRSLKFDPASETFVDDAEADKMLTRDYREPFVVPDTV